MFIVAPYVSIFGGTTATRLPELFAINTAAMVMIWTIVTLFLFVTFLLLYRRNPLTMSQQRLIPLPLLWGVHWLVSLPVLPSLVLSCTIHGYPS